MVDSCYIIALSITQICEQILCGDSFIHSCMGFEVLTMTLYLKSFGFLEL